MEKLFFQSSLPRAGSTMLQNIMAQNPDIYATPTSGVLELVYGARSNYSNSPEFKAQDNELMKKGFMSFCQNGMKGFYEGITDKKYVIDKSRGWGIHYGFLSQIFEEPKVICMVRDLRDIYCSMEKNFRKNQDKDMGIVNHADLQGTSTPKRIDIWANSQPVGMAIERLTEIFRQGINEKMLFIRYEDLCLYPEATMLKIYNYLEIPYFQHDFENIEQVTKEDDEVYGMFGDHTIRKSLELTPSTANKVLGTDVTEWIYTNYRWFYDTFKYEKNI
jgi:sulfotransferase